MNTWTTTAAAAIALSAGSAQAQSLFLNPAGSPAQSGPAFSAKEVSYFAVTPPPPREFAKHDLVTIIVDETSRQSSSQSLETAKDASADIGINSIIDPWHLLELRLRQGELANQTLLDTDFRRDFNGEGDYERSDRFSARIAATVLDVKPNGTLVLEARKVITKDKEVQTMLLSGIVRSEDVTSANTVLSSQLADLAISVVNEGDVRNAAKKGVITRVLDALFAF